MDLPVNVEHLPQFQTQNPNSEARTIRSVVIQKREALKRIEHKKREIEEDLVRLGVALGRSLLPDEILGHIFILLAQDHGSMKFPIARNEYPPQLVVSTVCSHWQKLAIGTPELWSDMELTTDSHHRIKLPYQWLRRTKRFPVKLSIKLGTGDTWAIPLQNVLLLVPNVKRLSLRLTYEQLEQLSILAETVLSGVSELELDVRSLRGHEMSNPHPLITRLRSVTFRGTNTNEEFKAWPDQFRLNLPWNQLRTLNYEINVQDPEHPIISILRQIPLLEVLSISIDNIVVPEQLTMPSLRNLALTLHMTVVDSSVMLDKMLRSIRCPYLTKFTLITHGCWTHETLEILKQQYNMQKLRHAKFIGNFALPVSSFLRDAPMLRSLSLQRDVVLDEETVTGVSNGTLGRFLRKLDVTINAINTWQDADGLFDMVEARKKMVDGLIENGCSWREEIAVSVLKDIVVHTDYPYRHTERAITLREAGITVTLLSY